MANREQFDNLIHRTKLELLNAGYDPQMFRIDLQPSVIVVVKPIRFIDGEVWDRLTALLQKFGFRWFREEGAWKRGMIAS